MSTIAYLRNVLLDLSQDGIAKRAQAAQTSGLIKASAVLAMGACGVVTVIGRLARGSFPLIGSFFALLGATGTVAAREAMVIARNTEEVLSNDGPMKNLTIRVSAAITEERFTNQITKDTWIVGPLFSTTIIRKMKEE